MVGCYLQLLVGYQRYQECVHNMWLDITLGYLQLLRLPLVTSITRLLGMCACNMWLDVTLGLITSIARFWDVTCGAESLFVNVFLVKWLKESVHTRDLPLPPPPPPPPPKKKIHLLQ